MGSACCSFLFNLCLDYLIDIRGLGRSWILKDALREVRHSSPWRPQSEVWAQQGGLCRHHWPDLNGKKRASNWRLCLGTFPRRGASVKC